MVEQAQQQRRLLVSQQLQGQRKPMQEKELQKTAAW
jgi:hypothetical protein